MVFPSQGQRSAQGLRKYLHEHEQIHSVFVGSSRQSAQPENNDGKNRPNGPIIPKGFSIVYGHPS